MRLTKVRKILVVGEPYFASAQARRLEACGYRVRTMVTQEWKKTSRWDRWRHLFWARYALFIYLKVSVRDLKAARILTHRTAILYIGSDVLRLQKKRSPYTQFLKHQSECIRYYAVSTALADELRELGIRAVHLPFIARPLAAEALPLPETFTVLSYVPPGKEAFYGLPTLLRLASDRPYWRFVVLGHSGEGMDQPPNMECTGWTDAPYTHIRNASVYVRLTRHDGLPNLIIESLALCRHVVWTFEHPHTYRYTDYGALCAHLDVLADSGEPNTAGMEYVMSEYGEDRLRRHYRELFA